MIVALSTTGMTDSLRCTVLNRSRMTVLDVHTVYADSHPILHVLTELSVSYQFIRLWCQTLQISAVLLLVWAAFCSNKNSNRRNLTQEKRIRKKLFCSPWIRTFQEHFIVKRSYYVFRAKRWVTGGILDREMININIQMMRGVVKLHQGPPTFVEGAIPQ